MMKYADGASTSSRFSSLSFTTPTPFYVLFLTLVFSVIKNYTTTPPSLRETSSTFSSLSLIPPKLLTSSWRKRQMCPRLRRCHKVFMSSADCRIYFFYRLSQTPYVLRQHARPSKSVEISICLAMSQKFGAGPKGIPLTKGERTKDLELLSAP